MLPHHLNFLMCTIVSSLVSAYSVAAWAYEEIEVKNGGTILGTVRFVGTPPAPEKIIITKDFAVCGKTMRFHETLEVGTNKGIKNVVVSLPHLQKGKKGESPRF